MVTATVQSVPNATSVLDLFSGTARVGHALKRLGYRVVANDYSAYARTLADCYVTADREDVLRDAETLLKEFSQLRGTHGYFTETFCIKSRFFQPKNGRKIDAIRSAIEEKCLDPELKSVVLVSLLEAADRVDSTCGVQMAYLKEWAPRSYNDLSLRMPDCLPQARHGKGESWQLDAIDACGQLSADIAYIDPPYNQHSYLSNYHIWETLALWDKPDHYGRACKRVDCQSRKSDFNSKRKFAAALEAIVQNINAQTIIMSFSNEGYATKDEIELMLSQRGTVTASSYPYKRYVGAQIGIYNHRGTKVGRVSHLQNTEYIYVVDVADLKGSTKKRPSRKPRLKRHEAQESPLVSA